MRILNLYAGIGGNRKLWEGHDVTAVELDEDIANVYKHYFPGDKMIIADAHQYLLENYKKFDFIWSSPPCPTHSQIRFNIGFKADRIYSKVKAVYPDMALYAEIILLGSYYEGLWVVENTIPYYKPLIDGILAGGHIWWSNFIITDLNHGNRNHRGGTVESLQERKGFDLSGHDLKEKRRVLRNCVEPETGMHILNCATGVVTHKNTKQERLFA